MGLNEFYYKSLMDSEEEIAELSEAFAEGLDIHQAKMKMDKTYVANIDGRKELEAIFERRLYLQYKAACTFHPFSEFGAECLEKAETMVGVYEKTVGPLTTRITKDNVDRFQGSLSADLIDDIRSGKYQAIGALRYDDGGISGVGALVYVVETDRLDDQYLLRIKWLYVKEAFRERGVATSLLGIMLRKAQKLENENVLFEAPMDREWRTAYTSLLAGWCFTFEAGLSPQLYLKMSEVEILDEMLDMTDGVNSLKSLPPEKRQKAMDLLAKKDDKLFKLLSRDLPEDYFDPELSCFGVNKGKVYGILLVHRLPSGMIRMEYYGGDQNNGGRLFSYMIIRAKESSDENTLVELYLESEEVSDYFDTYYEKHLRTPLLLASLHKPYGPNDTGIVDAAMLLANVEM